MPKVLHTSDPAFETEFATLLTQLREEAVDVRDVVTEIITRVRREGDSAIMDYTRRFDRFDMGAENLRLSRAEIDEIAAKTPKAEAQALSHAAERIKAYHQVQLPEDKSWIDPQGAQLGWRWSAVDAAGLYVPGGLASYPSSVLMNAIPAKVAGVGRLAMMVPTPDGAINPLVIQAAKLAGVDEIYRIGGAQAIAALAYGTQSVPPVDLITGPGNAYVAEAKRQVFGHVGIDMIAGPSEILVIADRHNDPEWIAIDLLSQAEHDASAQSVLITDDAGLAKEVEAAMTRIIPTLERAEIASASWRDHGVIVVAQNLEQAAEIANQFAPEHLEICVEDADALVPLIRHAGAIFVGKWTPEAIGDYIGGPNHVLPTSRSARFSSGLSVLSFMKRTTISKMSPEALKKIGPDGETLAKAESLEAHGLSIAQRLRHLNTP